MSSFIVRWNRTICCVRKYVSVFQRAEFFQFRPVRTSPRHISAPLESSGTPENNLDESTAISSEHLGSLITFSISCHYEQTLLNSNLRMSRISLCELCDCTMLCNVYKYCRYPQRSVQYNHCTVSDRDSGTRSNTDCTAQLPTKLISTERTVLASVYFCPASEFQGSAQ